MNNELMAAAVAVITLRAVIESEPDWGRDEILDHLGAMILNAPISTDDLDRCAALVESIIP